VEEALKTYRQQQRDVDAATLRRGLVSLAYAPQHSKYPTRMLVPALVGLLKNQPPEVSGVSLEVLGQLGDIRAFLPSCEMLLNDKLPKDLRVQAGQTAAMLVIGVESVPDVIASGLQELASGEDVPLRLAAARVLAKANIKQGIREDVVTRVAAQQLK
jgi:hypothetical protein